MQRITIECDSYNIHAHMRRQWTEDVSDDGRTTQLVQEHNSIRLGGNFRGGSGMFCAGHTVLPRHLCARNEKDRPSGRSTSCAISGTPRHVLAPVWPSLVHVEYTKDYAREELLPKKFRGGRRGILPSETVTVERAATLQRDPLLDL